MFKLLIDTGVWVDLARDPAQHALLSVVETMVRERRIALIVPRLVVEEFRRQRNQMARDGVKRIATHFEIIAAGIVPASTRSRDDEPDANDATDGGASVAGAPAHILDRIEALLTAEPPVEASALIKRRASERRLAQQAPFREDDDSPYPAQIIEIYADCAQSNDSTEVCLGFVTANTRDFSEPAGQAQAPHPDIGALFSNAASLYFVSLADALGRVAPALVADAVSAIGSTPVPPHMQAMLEAEELLSHQVQYHLHWHMLEKISQGAIRVIDDDDAASSSAEQATVTRAYLRDAIQAAKETERRYTKKNLGPWDPFEWGVLTGRLSVLRWMLREELHALKAPAAGDTLRKAAIRRQGARHTISSPIGASQMRTGSSRNN